jgi:Na+-driven multidrug efflux pump
MRRFLAAQGIINPAFYVLLTTMITHVAFLFIFIYIFQLGVFGVGLAISSTYNKNSIILQEIKTLKLTLVYSRLNFTPNLYLLPPELHSKTKYF